VARLAGLLDGAVGDRDARGLRRTGSSRATWRPVLGWRWSIARLGRES